MATTMLPFDAVKQYSPWINLLYGFIYSFFHGLYSCFNIGSTMSSTRFLRCCPFYKKLLKKLF